jgi:hypothetical protein
MAKGQTTMKTPIGALATIEWLDNGSTVENVYFSFSDGLEDTVDPDNGDIIADHWGIPDEDIFYFCTGLEDFKSLMTQGVEEFTVLEYDLVYKENDDD